MPKAYIVARRQPRNSRRRHGLEGRLKCSRIEQNAFRERLAFGTVHLMNLLKAEKNELFSICTSGARFVRAEVLVTTLVVSECDGSN